MDAVVEAITRLRSVGVDLRASGEGRIQARPLDLVPASDRALLKAHREFLVHLLRTGEILTPDSIALAAARRPGQVSALWWSMDSAPELFEAQVAAGEALCASWDVGRAQAWREALDSILAGYTAAGGDLGAAAPVWCWWSWFGNPLGSLIREQVGYPADEEAGLDRDPPPWPGPDRVVWLGDRSVPPPRPTRCCGGTSWWRLRPAGEWGCSTCSPPTCDEDLVERGESRVASAACRTCGSLRWWRIEGGSWICPRCHPPQRSDIEWREVEAPPPAPAREARPRREPLDLPGPEMSERACRREAACGDAPLWRLREGMSSWSCRRCDPPFVKARAMVEERWRDAWGGPT